MSQKVVIIGAVALGPKTACRLKRMMPDAQVTMIDKDSLISYGGCGIPYFISGDVGEAEQLMSTTFHMVRDPHFFRVAKGIDVLTRTEVQSIDRQAKTVHVRNLENGEEQDLPYDKLVLATGSSPNRIPIPGIELEGVFTVSSLNEAVCIKDLISKGQVGKAVVIGGGAIGIEMVEAMTDLWGVETTLIEVQDQLLPGVVSPLLARMATTHLREHEVENIYLSEKVQSIEGQGRVERVVTDRRTIETDLVIMSVGVHPSGDLAKSAGLEVAPNGAVVVNSSFQTSDPDIYAGGDCINNFHLITEKPVYMPLGSLANRHGRIIGTNLAGGNDEFPGVVGSFILKAFDLSVAATGLSLARALSEGFDAFSAIVVQGDRAHFFPGMEMMFLEMVVERKTGRILGLQGVSNKGDALATRIDAVAAILKYKPTTKDISTLELAYAPPFSSAMDILNALGNTAENLLAGRNKPIEPDEFAKIYENPGEYICLDVRAKPNAAPYVEKYPNTWINIPQDELLNRLDEVPRDKKLLLICNSGVRSYEAQIALDHLGIGPSLNLQGGMGFLKKSGIVDM